MILNLADSDPDVRAASVAHCCQCIRFAADVGATLYTVHPGFVAKPMTATLAREVKTAYDFKFSSDLVGLEQALNWAIDGLKRLVEEGDRHGVAVAVESQGSRTTPDVTLLERENEFDRLFEAIPTGLGLNLNLAHTRFAAAHHGFEANSFVTRWASRVVAVEISDNDNFADLHAPLEENSFALDYVQAFSNVPLILEFRRASPADLIRSMQLVRCRVAAFTSG